MTALLHNAPQDFVTGIKNIDMVMSSGDARIQISVNGSAYKDVASSIKTASSNFNITIPNCKIQAVITGDAVVNLENVKTGAV